MANRRKNARQRGGCLLSASGGLDGETPSRLGCDAARRRPRTDEGGEVWRSADAVRERAGRCSRSGIDKGQRILSRRVDQLQRCLSRGGVRIRVERDPRDRHIDRLLYSGEEGVNPSNHALVCYWLNGPRGIQFDAVIAVGDNVVSGANHWQG